MITAKHCSVPQQRIDGNHRFIVLAGASPTLQSQEAPLKEGTVTDHLRGYSSQKHNYGTTE